MPFPLRQLKERNALPLSDFCWIAISRSPDTKKKACGHVRRTQLDAFICLLLLLGWGGGSGAKLARNMPHATPVCGGDESDDAYLA